MALNGVELAVLELSNGAGSGCILEVGAVVGKIGAGAYTEAGAVGATVGCGAA